MRYAVKRTPAVPLADFGCDHAVSLLCRQLFVVFLLRFTAAFLDMVLTQPANFPVQQVASNIKTIGNKSFSIWITVNITATV